MNQTEVAHYLFVTSNRPTAGGVLPATKVIRDLLSSGYWLLRSRSRNRLKIKPGDKAVFFAAGQGNRIFVAAANIASTCLPITLEQKHLIDIENNKILDEQGFGFTNLHSFKIESVAFFEKPVRIEELLDQLSFIKSHSRWYLHFQGGSRSIPERDFKLIVRKGLD